MMKTIWEWMSSIVVALVIALLINAFAFQRMVVAGPSMEPTLRDSDQLFVQKITHTLSQLPDYGDVVVIDSRVGRKRNMSDELTETVQKLRMQPDYFFVKRVIGKPGDTIEFKNGAVWRNGEKLDEEYVKEPSGQDYNRIVKIPPGHLFVLGDNRNHSLDSRRIGSIPADHCLGIVFGKL